MARALATPVNLDSRVRMEVNELRAGAHGGSLNTMAFFVFECGRM